MARKKKTDSEPTATTEALVPAHQESTPPLPEYRDLALAHLDALAHAAIRNTKSEALSAGKPIEELETAEAYYEAAARIEAVAAQLGWLLPLQELALRYGLDPVELDALVWAFVQQSRTQGLPTLGEFLIARFDVSAERNQALSLFRPEAKLRHWGLMRLLVGPESLADNLLQRVISLPEPVNAFLMGERSLGELLATVATMLRVDENARPVRGIGEKRVGIPAEDELRGLLQHYVEHFGSSGQMVAPRSLVVELCAPRKAGTSSTIRQLARDFGALLVEFDASRLAVYPLQMQLQIIDEAAAVLRLYDAWLAIDRVEALEGNGPSLEALAKLTEKVPTAVFFTTRSTLPATHPLAVCALCHVDVSAPEETRQVLWRHELAEEGIVLPADEDLRMLASKFDFSAGLISNAARLVGLRSTRQGASPDFAELDASGYQQQRGNLGDVAKMRRGRGRLDDLVLPESEKVGIREIIRAATYRTKLLHGWGFKERFTYGTGIVALFSGEPGTGKSFAAEVIAGALGLDLFQVAAQQVVSKWVGETEKQIERIFEEAKASRAVLLFDEADSLLGARTEVKTASDRYANMATNQLLQAIEAYEGVVILTTNLEENLDSAAERRILFRIRFPFPGKEERTELWRRMLPKKAPKSDDIDFEELGEYYELSGGHIKNAIIRAGYEALERGTSLDMEALAEAAEREATTTGRLVRRDETGVYV
ncbi:MAG: ATP-binding protein [Myxococcota bacterium]|jgi:hypothetical protein|nr:ATP-binding protein [Myxococcota bacterium]